MALLHSRPSVKEIRQQPSCRSQAGTRSSRPSRSGTSCGSRTSRRRRGGPPSVSSSRHPDQAAQRSSTDRLGHTEGLGKLDTSLKRHTALLTRLRSSLHTPASVPAILKDVAGLALEKYVEEAVGAVLEGLAKCKSGPEISGAVEVRLPSVLTPPSECMSSPRDGRPSRSSRPSTSGFQTYSPRRSSPCCSARSSRAARATRTGTSATRTTRRASCARGVSCASSASSRPSRSCARTAAREQSATSAGACSRNS